MEIIFLIMVVLVVLWVAAWGFGKWYEARHNRPLLAADDAVVSTADDDDLLSEVADNVQYLIQITESVLSSRAKTNPDIPRLSHRPDQTDGVQTGSDGAELDIPADKRAALLSLFVALRKDGWSRGKAAGAARAIGFPLDSNLWSEAGKTLDTLPAPTPTATAPVSGRQIDPTQFAADVYVSPPITRQEPPISKGVFSDEPQPA